MADEVLISSCSMVCHRYFGWHGSSAGLLLACLGALILPADYVVERASRVFSERKIMKVSVLFIIASLLALLNYEAMFFDVYGFAAQKVQSNVTHETEISIAGTTVGEIQNRKGEFPYDWAAGPFVYIPFLSAVFMGKCAFNCCCAPPIPPCALLTDIGYFTPIPHSHTRKQNRNHHPRGRRYVCHGQGDSGQAKQRVR